MTVVAAAVGPDGTWMGADGQASIDELITTTTERKWNVSPDGWWAFAGAGEVAFDSVLVEDDLWPLGKDGPQNDPEVGRRTLAGRMRQKLAAVDGFQLVRDEDSIFGDYRWSPLVVTEGHVWRLCSDLRSFEEPMEGAYHACGSGMDYAIGAMSALLDRGVTSAEELVRAGVGAACRLTTQCGGEVFVQRLEAA